MRRGLELKSEAWLGMACVTDCLGGAGAKETAEAWAPVTERERHLVEKEREVREKTGSLGTESSHHRPTGSSTSGAKSP